MASGGARARRGPALALVLLCLGTGFSVVLSLAHASTDIIAEDPLTVRSSLTTVWVMAGLVLPFILVTALRRRQPKVLLALLTLAVCLLGTAAFATVRIEDTAGYREQLVDARQARDDLIAAAGNACRDQAVPGVPPRGDTDSASSGGDLLPLVILNKGGGAFGLQETVHRGWFPAVLRDLRTVACLGGEQKQVGYCNYTGGMSYKITHVSRAIRIMDASTGRELSSDSLEGHVPLCKPKIYGQQGDVTGDSVGSSDVIDYLAQQISPTSTPTP